MSRANVWMTLVFIFAAQFGFPAALSFTADELLNARPKTVDFAAKPGQRTALVFLSAHCPCSISHEPSLTALSAKHPEVQFVGVISDPKDTLTEVRAHFSKTSLPFPLLADTDQKLANRWDAAKTPHAFLFDAGGKILYRGAVDNSHDAKRATKFYLADALEALRLGSDLKVKETKPLGCAISR